MENSFCTPLDITQIEQNFAEINRAMTAQEAMQEASRCLYCYDAPCIQACPTGIDVPTFIKKIASGNVTGSARTIFDANPIGASCARVCPVEVLCEGACVEKTLINKPIEIGRLQRFATDFAMAAGKQLFHAGEPTGKSVGIVGSGPSGLSCATYLARLGYAVTVYERRPEAGGLDTYGMAEYKMPKSVSQAEVEQVKKLGVEFRLNTAVGADVSFDDLRSSHDAIFLAVGLGDTNKLIIPGEDLQGVIDALHFIERIKTREWKSVPLGRNVVVLGAGNTAIDAVTQAKRLGAKKVTLVYRRTEKDAPAYDYEMELARKDGIEFMWQTSPVEILGEDRVSGMRVTDAAGLVSEIECDQVIKAIGQQKMASFFTDIAGVAIDEKGRVAINENMRTSDPKIFAGGDCANGGAEAVDASQMGKKAAIGIHEVLTGDKVEFAGAILRDTPTAPADPNRH
ncbi:MAG: NAD(P)-dependent oxidoreductase [Pyrinomonadaceae bacterium]|nr:NAD(P)-dependent oxidoreductase [Pyrinomonadaceae bacterium]